MPELPEVETVRRGLAPALEGARVEALDQRRPDLRFPLPDRFADRVVGATITSLSRRAKYLIATLSTDESLIMHLGMSGSFRVAPKGEDGQTPGVFHHERSKLSAHDHVVFEVHGGALGPATVTYNDPRRFGFMVMTPSASLHEHPLMKSIGIEPLGNALNGALIARLFADKRTNLKAALLDQSLIAGLGNIYVCEALWRSGLAPTREASTLAKVDGSPTVKAERLADAIRAVLTEAIAAGGSSLRDHMQTSGELGYFQHAFNVYDREGEPCRTPRCRGQVERLVQSNRSTFFCATCQR